MTATRSKTLFDVLGVRPDATDADVEAAYARFHFGLDPIVPVDVTEAYRFLQKAENRQWYWEVLSACREEEMLDIPSDKFATFELFCRRAEISIFPDPKIPNTYAVRLPGQTPPRWTEDSAPVGHPGPPVPRIRKRLWDVLEAVLLLGAFRRARLGQKVGLVLLYIVVIAAAAVGARWAAGEFTAYRAASLAATVKARHAEAIEKLAKLEARAKTVASEFTAVTGAMVDPVSGKMTRPRPEVDEAILRHDTVREAWAAIENGRVRPTEIESTGKTLAIIGGRIQTQTFVPDDRVRLDDLIGWIDRSSTRLANQSRFVKHIKLMLETDLYERSGQPAERSGS